MSEAKLNAIKKPKRFDIDTSPMDSKSKLRRYCCVGSFEPVYVHLNRSINVTAVWLLVEPMVATINDTEFISLLRDLLIETPLIRKDETLFVYAAYLASTVENKWKTAVRQAFPVLIETDDDLFLFCKYAALISKELRRRVFSKTVRKAIIAWYAARNADAIRSMWVEHRGLHGFTHRVLFKLCHISDDVLGCPSEIVKPFFKTCTQIVNEHEIEPLIKQEASTAEASTAEASTAEASTAEASAAEASTAEASTAEAKQAAASAPAPAAPAAAAPAAAAPAAAAPAAPAPAAAVPPPPPPQSSSSEAALASITPDTPAEVDDKMEVEQEEPKSTATVNGGLPGDVVVAISKLRRTVSKIEAIQIIRKFKLRYKQVPGHLLRYPAVMEAVLPSMPYIQILKNWRKMGRLHQLKNVKLFSKIKKLLDDKHSFKAQRLYPIHILLYMCAATKIRDRSKLPVKRKETLKINFLNKLYDESFLWHQNSGQLRMHITVNLQKNYTKKYLKNHKYVSYIEACWALVYGYFKREQHVDIFHWTDNKLLLKRIEFDKNETDLKNFEKFKSIQNPRNYQILTNPTVNASLNPGIVYDVFLCIVPTAGRGNPKQKSDYLCKFIDRYRQVNNPKAKFIILDLLKYKRSMTYDMSRCQNILEICGLDEHTTDLIYNFATHRFD